MYPGYYTGIDGRRQIHLGDRVPQYGHCHCHCHCGHQPIVSGSWEWNNIDDTPIKQENNGKKSDSKKPKVGGTKTVGVFKFLRLSLAKSSVSGVNSISSSKSIIAKLIWTVILICCCAGFGYQTFGFLLLYNRKPSIVLTDIQNDGEADFPAVTICNKNRMRKSVYCANYPENCTNIVDEPLKVPKSEIYKIIFDTIQSNQTLLKHAYGHNRSMIQSCVFSGYPPLDKEQCWNNTRYLYDPGYGNCYVIPSEVMSTGEHLRAGEADFWREANDLTILLDIQRDEFIEAKRDPGVMLTIHPGETYPDIHTDGRELVAGKAYSIGVQKTTIVYLPLPYKTNCTNFSKLPWNIYTRQMTSRMCTVGCSQHYQFKKCGFVVRSLSLFYETLPFNMSTITPEQEKCAADEEKDSMELCREVCGMPCQNTFFESDESASELTRREITIYKHDEWHGVDDARDKANLISVRIFYKTLETRVFRHTPKYETMELFSYLGGYSGVWLGFSLLTMYELLEIIFATFKFFLFKRKKRVQQKKSVRSLVEMKKMPKQMDTRKRKPRFDFK